VVLRHQLAILGRGGKRPRYSTADRALLAAASRLLPPERWSCFAVSPPTLRRWHRALLRGGRRHRRRSGRPPLAAETRRLIKRLARENARWGYMRIQGELLKLGISVSATTVANVLRTSGLGPAPRRIGPSWSEFLRAQAQSMLGGNLGSELGDDGLACAAPDPRGPAKEPPLRTLEADDQRAPVAAGEPCLAGELLAVRGSPPPPRRRVLPATRGPPRLPPPQRSRARDGLPRAASRSAPRRSAHARRQTIAGSRRHPPNQRVDPRTTARVLTLEASTHEIDHHLELTGPNRVSVPHTASKPDGSTSGPGSLCRPEGPPVRTGDTHRCSMSARTL
jgi:Homeodomain-like domain